MNIEKDIKKICFYYVKYDNQKLNSKLAELELLTGYSLADLRLWIKNFKSLLNDSSDNINEKEKKFDNDLLEIVNNNKNKSKKSFKNEIDKIFNYLKEDKNEIIINNDTIRIYSIKTSIDSIVNEILDKNVRNVYIRKLNWYKDKIKIGDLIFLVLGGDKKPWNNGLISFGKVIKIIDSEPLTKNYEIVVEKLVLLPTEITPEDLYFYPDTRNAINIGPALKGTPNQAINKLSKKAFYSVIKAMIDLIPNSLDDIEKNISSNHLERAYEAPLIQTKGRYKENQIINNLYLDIEGGTELADFIDDSYVDIDDFGATEKEFKKQLMEKSMVNLKKDVSILSESLSIYDLYRKYMRYADYTNNENKNDLSNLEDSLILSPDFQREEVWSRTKNIELIESILLGIPLPSFYFSQDINGNYLVVDGKQRLTAIFKFLNNVYTLPEYYEFLFKEKDAKFIYSNLQSRIQRKIEDFSLTCYTVKPQTEPSIQNEIFIRVNRGGVSLNHQEIRYAINIGKVTNLLLDRISENKELNIVNKNRKRDQYIALRYFAFYFMFKETNFKTKYNFEEKYENMNNFLDVIMKYINKLNDGDVLALYENYKLNIQKSNLFFNTIGKKRFTRINSKTLNMNIFETWMLVLNEFNENQVQTHIEIFKKYYFELIQDKGFLNNILSLRDQKEKIIERLNYIEIYSKKIKQEINND